ncbi:MAG: MGMT family protein [Oscillospiraceae bacterium]
MEKLEYFSSVYKIVSGIPCGKVATYGLIALLTGFPERARMVGNAMAVCPDGLCWYRVVNSVGRLVPNHEELQRELLSSEGVTFRENGHVNLRLHLWRPFS